jgi:hypothetical protein
VTGLPLDPVADPAAVERWALRRALHAEGIPMVLALEDVSGAARPGAPEVPDVVRDVGRALAQRVEDYRAVLRPGAGDDDEAAVHDVVVVVAAAHGPVRP